MKKYILIFVVLFSSMTLTAETYDDFFWNEITKGNFQNAAERGNFIGLENPHYHLLSSVLYMILNKNEESQKQYNLFTDRISDYPPELIEKEFNVYLHKNNSNIHSFVGVFVFQFKNIFSLNSNELLYKSYDFDNKNYIANNYLSMFEFNKGNIDKSLEHALVSIEESENYSEPYVNAANSYNSLDQQEKAIEILFQALEECQEPHENTYLSLFYHLGESGSGIVQNFNQTLMAAIIHFEKESLDIFYNRLNELPNIYFSLIDNLIEKGCYSEADNLLNRSSEVKIERISYLKTKLFYKAYTQNRFNEAVQKYIILKHTDLEVVVDVAFMSLQFENYDGAKQLYTEFIKMNPNMNSYRLMTSYSNLGTAYANLEEYDEAFKYWDLALTIAPNDEITLANIEKFKKLIYKNK